MNKSINFTEQEANALLILIDIAIKTRGIEAAEAGVILTKKIKESFKEDIKEEKEEIKEK
jgi:hypothetical protein